jgi:hypothetical protein
MRKILSALSLLEQPVMTARPSKLLAITATSFFLLNINPPQNSYADRGVGRD